ncbi:MAG TPA: hypothetical protein VI230_06070 [Ignavibacteriaceae bacterium]
MNTIMDILTSTIIGGMLLLLVLKLNLFMSEAGYSSDTELRLQQDTKTLAEIMNSDFRKIGYKYDDTAILTAQKDRFKFIGDLERPGQPGAGAVDTVEYFLEDSTHSLGTSNLNDIILVRVLNNKDTIDGPSLGLVKMQFTYLDSVSTPTADLTKIRYIKTEMWVEPTESRNNFVTGNNDSTFTYWEFTIYPRNI